MGVYGRQYSFRDLSGKYTVVGFPQSFADLVAKVKPADVNISTTWGPQTFYAIIQISPDKGGNMKKLAFLFLVFIVVCSLPVAGVSAKEASKESKGERLFMKHCSKCHPDGSNVVTVTKSLNSKDREANTVKTEEDIIKLMRNPGPGMVKFGTKVISEKDAKAIAEYVLKSFK